MGESGRVEGVDESLEIGSLSRVLSCVDEIIIWVNLRYLSLK